jgi:voltage-gated potassium channel
MLSGIAVLGVVTASIASWLVQRVSATTETAVEKAEQPVLAEITDLAAEVAALRREIAQLRDAQLGDPQLRSRRPS